MSSDYSDPCWNSVICNDHHDDEDEQVRLKGVGVTTPKKTTENSTGPIGFNKDSNFSRSPFGSKSTLLLLLI